MLLVDDEPDQLEILEEWLQSKFNVSSCVSPLEALSVAEKSNFDLIISDFSMPEMNGVNFVAKLSKLKPKSIMRVIMLTGISDDLTLSVIESMPQITLVKKPINKNDFLAAVERAMS